MNWKEVCLPVHSGFQNRMRGYHSLTAANAMPQQRHVEPAKKRRANPTNVVSERTSLRNPLLLSTPRSSLAQASSHPINNIKQHIRFTPQHFFLRSAHNHAIIKAEPLLSLPCVGNVVSIVDLALVHDDAGESVEGF